MLILEGRSINKLQNGPIPLILKIGKIRNIRFVENLIGDIQRVSELKQKLRRNSTELNSTSS